MRAPFTYLPGLDGLRALAVVLVVIFHTFHDVLPGGFVGVDIFFVLSGFLITGIMSAEMERSGSLDLRAFWGRRIRRLMPAVIVLVVATSIATALVDDGATNQIPHVAHALGALTWTMNLVPVLFGSSAWMGPPVDTALGHLWSLAIEEQFYLVWPLAALGLMKWVRSRATRLVFVGVAMACSVALMGLAGPVGGYFRTDARAFELLAGAALSIGLAGRSIPAKVATPAAVVGLVGIGVVAQQVEAESAWLYPGGFVLVTSFALCLVAACAFPPAWLGPIAGAPVARVVGQRSYGIYLWHMPILVVLTPARLGLEDTAWAANIVRLVVLIVVVEASYRLVEAPVRERRIPFGVPQVALGYGAAVLSLLLLWPGVSRGWDARFDHPTPPPAAAPTATKVLVVGDFVAQLVPPSLSDSALPDSALSVWDATDGACSLLARTEPVSGEADLVDSAAERSTYCDHLRRRWERAIDRFEPDVVIWANGLYDTDTVAMASEPVGASEEIDARGRQLDRALESLAGPHQLIVVSVQDWSQLWPDGEASSERDAAAQRHNAALAEATANAQTHNAVELWSIDGAVTWNELQSRFSDLAADLKMG